MISSPGIHPPPSFASSRTAVIYRRVRRPQIKSDYLPPRFLYLPNAFEFSGWGRMERLSLSDRDTALGESGVQATRNGQVLGQFTASALAGNAVLGSIFYALPPVVAVGGVLWVFLSTSNAPQIRFCSVPRFR